MRLAIRSTLDMNHGGAIPLLGLGTFRAPGDGSARAAVLAALDAGYRHVDTAAIYENEEDVGAAIRESGVPRDEIFVTTKLSRHDHGYDQALRGLDESLGRLGLDYVDLYLIHWPESDRRLESWDALARLREEGRTRAIGVSNYTPDHLAELLDHSAVVPALNQFELHPFNWRSRRDFVDACREHDIVVEGYAPLVKAKRLGDDTLERVARAHGKSTAQVLIRWALQHGIVTIPKSENPDRIRQNADVFDFALDEEQMRLLDGLDEGLTTSWDPREVE